MPLTLDTHLARIPELGTPSRHAFALFEVSAQRAGISPATRLADDAPYRDADPDPNARSPIFVALAIDASSSMRGPRFALAVQTARDLVDSLAPADRVAVITFERHSRLALPPTSIDDEGKLEAHRVLDRLSTGTGTNMAAGWREAAEAMSRLMLPESSRRIILLTDGLPSQGEKDPAALAKMVSEGRTRGLETSVVGLGDGIDEALCAQLARAGDGRFFYVRNESLLGDVVAHEIEGARRLAATDTTLVLAFSARVDRAEVMHRFQCHTEKRSVEVRLGAVAYQMPRVVLVQMEVHDAASDAVLGAAVARGRAVIERRGAPTSAGYPLGARAAGEVSDDRETSSERLTLSLAAGLGPEESRRRIALEVLSLRTLAEVRAAWEGFDARDRDAVARRLGRARELRVKLADAGLVPAGAVPSLPDVDAIEAAMLGSGDAREARRTFASWAHNTQTSQPMPAFVKKKE